jgi:hypothetical protein
MEVFLMMCDYGRFFGGSEGIVRRFSGFLKNLQPLNRKTSRTPNISTNRVPSLLPGSGSEINS